ncbi:MAG: RNA polymerase sigma factor [Gemmatimonadaceae bacterium]|nr:RNA polymerase sigma factor [Gemmatimonadaceae bacterium]
MTPSDATLVHQVLAGQTDTFAVLVDRYHAACLRVATNLLGNADDAEDVVQDSFVRAYRHLGSYQERDRFGAWLTRIVVNQCRTRASKEARYVPFDHERAPGNVENPLAALTAAPDVEHKERVAELRHALAQLGTEHREAIVLRFGEELSYEEMASLTGVGVSALKMRVQRACARLRTLLSEQLFS